MECITHNPATGEVFKTYPFLTKDEIHQRIIATHKTYNEWRFSSWGKREACAKKLATLLRERSGELAWIITTEMGKTLVQAEQEVLKCVMACEHYAKHAEKYLAPSEIHTQMKKSSVIYQPLGIVLGIMPWNFPFWQAIRFAIPSLMAGNTCLLKHASNVTGCSIALEKLFLEAGFPQNAFTNLIIPNTQVSEVIKNPLVAAVTLTGSETAGRSVAAEAGHVLKKVVLELGGSDPYIVLEDADLDLAAYAITTSRYTNSGQSCIAAKRVLAVDAIREDLQQRIIAIAKDYTYGDPMDPHTKLGPLARYDLREALHKQVLISVAQGANVPCGGYLPETVGYYYPATVLTDVPPGTPAYDEELFGPVISFISVKNVEEAIKVANASSFGLAASIFTNNLEEAERIALLIESGSVTINQFTVSDPRLPFGGIKNSGFGRELGSFGIHEFVNIKTINIA